jgi:hypothetical protein
MLKASPLVTLIVASVCPLFGVKPDNCLLFGSATEDFLIGHISGIRIMKVSIKT